MCHKYFTSCWIKSALRRSSSNKSATLRFYFCVWAWGLIILTACTPLAQTDNMPTIDNTPELVESVTVPTSPSPLEASLEVSSLVVTQVTNTPLSQPEPTVIPSPTLLHTVTTEIVTLTPTPVLQSEPQNVTGQLFISDLVGIQRINLADNTSEYLLTAENDWIDWGANFAQNKKYLAYWIRRANGNELWFTPLPQWQPERILVLENDVQYDFSGARWAVNDRYILFSLAVRDNSGPLEEVKTVRTYVIDTETMELISQPYWPGDCSILAASSQTGQLALWCEQVQPEGEEQEFLVLEAEEPPWLTQDPPEPLIDNCLIMAVCDWSQDSDFVAYVVQEGRPDSLFYTSVDHVMPIHLDDKRTNYHSFPVWSPDSQFLYYSGACVGADLQCPNVISVADQEVIWRARNNNNHGEMGIISVNNVVWAPNSRHIAIPVLEDQNGIESSVILFDILTQQEIGHLAGTDYIMDMVWVDN